MNVILFYGIPLAIGSLFFYSEHYIVCFIYIVAVSLQDFLPNAIMNRDGDVRFLVLLNLLAQVVVTAGTVYAIYLLIRLLFF